MKEQQNEINEIIDRIDSKIKKMPKNLLTHQQAMENDLLLQIGKDYTQEQIVFGYSSQIFLSSTISIFSLSKFVASYRVLNPNFEMKGKHDSETTIVHLMEELGEVARQLYNQKMGRAELDIKNLEEEIADCVILLNRLATLYNIDVEEAIKNKIKKMPKNLLFLCQEHRVFPQIFSLCDPHFLSFKSVVPRARSIKHRFEINELKRRHNL